MLPPQAPVSGGPLPATPDLVHLLGCGGSAGERSNPENPEGVEAESQDPAQPTRKQGKGAGGTAGWCEEIDEEEEAPPLGRAWQSGRCFTIPMTVLYRISPDLGQARPFHWTGNVSLSVKTCQPCVERT